MNPKTQCCDVETMCGRTLWQGVVFVGIATVVRKISIFGILPVLQYVIATVVLVASVGFVISMSASGLLYNNQPTLAVNLVFALVSTSISSYQIVISLLLLYHAYGMKSKVYVCSLWYVSHLSILTFYGLLFSSKVVVCFSEKHYFSAISTLLLGFGYQALYIYFAIVVNSYLHSLNEDRYL